MSRDEQAPAEQAGASPVPGDERISGAELRVWLDWLGLPQRSAAELLGVREDTIRRWLSGKESIPVRVGEEMEMLDVRAATAVGEVVTALQDMRDPAVVIYRRDEDVWADRPEFQPYPASWWRMVVARATVEVPGVEVAYWDGVRA